MQNILLLELWTLFSFSSSISVLKGLVSGSNYQTHFSSNTLLQFVNCIITQIKCKKCAKSKKKMVSKDLFTEKTFFSNFVIF